MSAASFQKDHYGQSSDVGCKLIPFPQSRRRRFIMKTVTRLVGSPTKTAEKLLAATLQQQARVMARKGVPPDLIERERRKLEGAIRAALWQQILLRPDDGVA
jgi:hypothetical protein